MWNKFGSGSYRDVDLIECLNHKSYHKFYHNFYRQSYRQRQSHDLVDNLHGWSYQTAGNVQFCLQFAQFELSKGGQLAAINLLEWAVLLAICTV